MKDTHMTKLTFVEARNLYASTGHCVHDKEFYTVSKPPNCGVKIINCGICSERMSLVYLD